jgi:enoyl-CoA hydratase
MKATPHGSVALLTMDDGRVNAINIDLCEELIRLLDEVEHSSAVVLTGRARVFSAGLDLRALCGVNKGDAEALFHIMSRAMETVFCFPKPIIAACSGHAIGGGAVLMLGCDERLGESSGKLHIHATGLGIPYPTVVLEIVTLALGATIGQRTLLLGAPVRGSCRQREGWMHEIVPGADLLPRALGRAKELSLLDAKSFANTKSRLRAQTVAQITANKDSDAKAFVAGIRSKDTQVRIEAAVQRLDEARAS